MEAGFFIIITYLLLIHKFLEVVLWVRFDVETLLCHHLIQSLRPMSSLEDLLPHRRNDGTDWRVISDRDDWGKDKRDSFRHLVDVLEEVIGIFFSAKLIFYIHYYYYYFDFIG